MRISEVMAGAYRHPNNRKELKKQKPEVEHKGLFVNENPDPDSDILDLSPKAVEMSQDRMPSIPRNNQTGREIADELFRHPELTVSLLQDRLAQLLRRIEKFAF